ncbi:transport system periplasmic binding protein [Salmonella enterica subsp. enterica]|uniref:Transport system periplasmic binding protein n=1 Tax=Salmonella enterica I TaxID=59201 RepID=A0A447TQW5_SALET|nr:transport system periplasmic binding protein [Salmonella enterica subsp. enterica]
MHTRIPDILLMSTLTLEKLTPEQQRIVEAAIKASIEFEKAAWDKEIEKTRLAAVKDFNVGILRDRQKTLPGGSTAYLRRSEKQTAALRAVSTYPDSKKLI